MGLITVFLCFYLWINRKSLKLPQAFVLLPIALCLTWILNVLRIALLIAIVISISSDIALYGFHSQAGWISFLLIAVFFLWVTPKLFGLEINIEKKNPSKINDNKLADALIIPFIVLMIAQMFTAAMSKEADLLYPLKIVIASCFLWHYKFTYQAILSKVHWQSIVIGVSVFVVWFGLESIQGSNNNTQPQWLTNLPAGYQLTWQAFRIIGSCLIVPIVEELFFRGYVLRKLISANFEIVDISRFTLLPWLITSVIFGLLHQRWFAGTLAGLCFTYAQYLRGSLLDAVIAHITTNILIAIMVVGFGQWTFWN